MIFMDRCRIAPAAERSPSGTPDRCEPPNDKPTGADMTASEMEIRVILENMIDVVVILDGDGVFRAVSPSARWTLGYEPARIVGTVSFDYVFPEDLERVHLTFRKTLKTDRETERFRFRHADGRFLWLETVARSVWKEDNFQGIIVSARDITERIRVEEKFRERDRRYRLIVENANDAIYLHDFDGIIIDVNEIACRMLGYEREELIGSNLGMIDGKWNQPENPELDSLLKQERHSFERWNVRKDGTEIPVEVSVKVVDWKGRGLIMGFVRDITDRKAAEAKLLRSEKQYRLLVENTMDYVARFHLDGTILFVSEAVESVLGYLPKEIVGGSFLDLVHPDDRTAAGNVFLGVLKEEKQGGLECRLRTKDGRYRWVESRGRVFRNDVTGRMEIFSVARDVTVQKNAEEELRNTLNNLEDLVQERTAELKEANTALRVLLDRSKEDRKILEERLQRNLNELLIPTLDGLRSCGLNRKGLLFLDLLQSNLRDITSPFLSRLTSSYRNLTPREIQVAGMIREGKRTKEIAELLGVSTVTVDSHRISIRTKLGLTGEKVNLRSHLLSMT